jgi:hypothetical protein
MSKLIISQIDVFTGAFGTTSPSSYIGSIKDFTVDGLQYFPEPNQVTVEDGQTINESYNVPIEIRTRKLAFENGTQVADSSGTTTGAANNENLLTGSNSPFMVDDASDSKTECFLRFVTQGASVSDLKTGGVVLNGYQDFSNGRREVVLQGNIEVITASDGVGQE